jgi:NADH-quinone oxidoreductase subunit I
MSVPTIEVQRGKVVEVQRDDQRARSGAGLLRGMGVIWKHWQKSFQKNRSAAQIHGTFTLEYPDEKPQLAPNFRNMPILLFDEQTGHELCTSCYQCQRICPPQVIHMTQAKDPATGKAVPAVAEFMIEYDACMSCGFCAEVCPFDAIKMDHEFELSTDDHAGLTRDKNALLRPIGYYEGLAPAQWAEVAAGAMKKLQGNAKRRPDVIGIAPMLSDKIAARRAELAEAAAAAPPTAAAPAPAPAAPAQKLSAEEKAAKLAAIRAAKAGGAAAETPAAETPAAAPADDKAAKPAAIRAANAAKTAAAETATAAPADDKAAKLAAIRAANAAKNAAAAPAAVEPAAPLDEKAAKLAAIRAANAAKKAAAEPAAVEPAPVEPAAPLDEKAAKLAAIRAANAAKKAQSGNDGSA